MSLRLNLDAGEKEGAIVLDWEDEPDKVRRQERIIDSLLQLRDYQNKIINGLEQSRDETTEKLKMLKIEDAVKKKMEKDECRNKKSNKKKSKS